MEAPQHAIVFPFPAQGHINPMMQLALRLVDEGFFVTFVNTHWVQARIGRRVVQLEGPRFRFEQLDDGLPKEHGGFSEGFEETLVAFLALSGEMARLVRRISAMNDRPPPTCLVGDALCDWMQDVADQFRLPRVALCTTPAHFNLLYHFQSTLIQRGYIPISPPSSSSEKGRRAEEVEDIVNCIDGLPPLRLQDLYSFFLVESSSDFMFQLTLRLFMRRLREAAWSLGNNLEELEKEAVAAFRKQVPNFLPIGPLLLRNDNNKNVHGLCNLVPEESSACADWLDAQTASSVLYISFGSVAQMPPQDLASLVQGVQQSSVPFLWAVRPDQSAGSAPLEALRADIAAHRTPGLIVAWAPQVDVLNHPSVAAFLTHCGWNSLLESFCAGVPVLAAATSSLAEQRMNAHYVSHIWGFGVRMPDNATASIVASQIRHFLQPSSLATFRERLAVFKATATAAQLPPHGASYKNFRRFLDDMRERRGRTPACVYGHGCDVEGSKRMCDGCAPQVDAPGETD